MLITTAMTTAPRDITTIEMCLQTVLEAGLAPYVFAEPNAFKPPQATKCVWHDNSETLGAWQNWMQAATVASDQFCDLCVILQDDCLLHPQTVEVIENHRWLPDHAFLSLYTSPEQFENSVGGGWVRFETGLKYSGCLCTVFRRDTLLELLKSDIATQWPRRCPGTQIGLTKHVDTMLGMWAKETGRSIVGTVPCVAQHIGHTSTLGHDRGRLRVSPCFAGDSWLPDDFPNTLLAQYSCFTSRKGKLHVVLTTGNRMLTLPIDSDWYQNMPRTVTLEWDGHEYRFSAAQQVSPS